MYKTHTIHSATCDNCPATVWSKGGENPIPFLMRLSSTWKISFSEGTEVCPTCAKFLELRDEWKRDTAFMSSITDIVEHPAYQSIIAMGQVVVPLMLRELEKRPEMWFSALRSLTGANPGNIEDAGKIDVMARAWVRWGGDNGYL